MRLHLRTIATGEPVAIQIFDPITRRWLDIETYPPEGVVLVADVTARRRAHDVARFMAEASRILRRRSTTRRPYLPWPRRRCRGSATGAR